MLSLVFRSECVGLEVADGSVRPAHIQPGVISRYRTYGSGWVAGEARSGLDAASKAALLAPFSLAQAREFPKQLGAAVQVLHAAVTLHPSLAEALLLPTSLSDSGSSDSNKVQAAPAHL